MCFADPKKQARCIFEYIYFSRPDAVFDGVGVYASRIRAGRFLAQDSPVEADLVVGVPESGNPAAQGYAIESKIPYGIAFIKNSYVGRTFIKPKQSMRESSVQVKLNVLKDNVRGKRIIMIDDSIVRGTTCGRIVQMLKDAGGEGSACAHQFAAVSASVLFRDGHPTEDQLIAHGRTVEEIRQIIGADSLAYLRMERLPEICEGLPFCDACFSGNYPLDPPDHDIRGEQDKRCLYPHKSRRTVRLCEPAVPWLRHGRTFTLTVITERNRRKTMYDKYQSPLSERYASKRCSISSHRTRSSRHGESSDRSGGDRV